MSSVLNSQTYTMPDESEPHEGTWLQWPHGHEYGNSFMTENNATWVAMTNALQANEKVHIIHYDATHKTQILSLLSSASVPTTNITFHLSQTNDVWSRDNFGVFLRDASGSLVLGDFGFNGWGGDYNFTKDNLVPAVASNVTGIPLLNLNDILTVEGGGYEMDGHGVFLSTKTSVLSQSNPAGILSIRNPGMTQAQCEAIAKQYLGAEKFYWLEGAFSKEDITDMHIDGFAKFAPGNNLVTMNTTDLLYWGLVQSDVDILYGITNKNNTPYTKVYLPLTAKNVSKTNGTSLGYKGSYCNFYVANNRVLVPNYNDSNDAVANAIIANLYPGRTIVGINVQNLYGNGGMVHCVTQQQPIATTTGLNKLKATGVSLEQNFPNPANDVTTISISLDKEADCQIVVYNSVGQLVATVVNSHLSAGKHPFAVNVQNLQNGIYNYTLKVNTLPINSKRMIIVK